MLKIAVGGHENIKKSVVDIKQHRIEKHHLDNMEPISQKEQNHQTHEDFICHLQRLLNNCAKFWRCMERKCRGLIHVINNDTKNNWKL